jgi:hypothetical protein
MHKFTKIPRSGFWWPIFTDCRLFADSPFKIRDYLHYSHNLYYLQARFQVLTYVL